MKILTIITAAILSQAWSASQQFDGDNLTDYTSTARNPTAKLVTYTHDSTGGVVAAHTVISALTMLPDQDVFQISTGAASAAVALSYNGVVNILRAESRLSFMGPGAHTYDTASTFTGPTTVGSYARLRLMGPGIVTLPNSMSGNITIESLIDSAKISSATAGIFTANLILTRNLTTGASITTLSGSIKGKAGTLILNPACVNISSTFDKDFCGVLQTGSGGANTTFTNPVGKKASLILSSAVNYTMTNGGTIHKLIPTAAAILNSSANLMIEELDLTRAALTLIPTLGTTITVRKILTGSNNALTLGSASAISGSIVVLCGGTSGGIAIAAGGLTSISLPDN